MVTTSNIMKLHELVFGNPAKVVVSAPGRLDFLNTHQDYKGLPVVGVGINLRTYVAASRSKNYCEAYSATTDERVRFQLDEPVLQERGFNGYVKAAVIALRKLGYKFGCFRTVVDSDVPIASGLASSAALLVSLIGAISTLYGLRLSIKEVAETAFRAENEVMGIPCGRLDQYSSAYGGIVLIETRPPYNVEQLEPLRGLFVVADSGIKHSTAKIHPERQREIEEGLRALIEQQLPERLRRLLGEKYWEPKWEELEEEELSPYLQRIPEKPAMRILYTLRAHRSTMIAVKIMKNMDLSRDEKEWLKSQVGVEPVAPKLKLIGAIMTYQHRLLSQLYEVSLPLLDRIIDSAINAGALGAKLSGAGLGGAVIALTEDEATAKKTLKAMIDAGAVKGWAVSIDKGLTKHYTPIPNT